MEDLKCRVGVALQQDVKDDLYRYCRDNDIPVSMLLRALIRDYLYGTQHEVSMITNHKKPRHGERG